VQAEDLPVAVGLTPVDSRACTLTVPPASPTFNTSASAATEVYGGCDHADECRFGPLAPPPGHDQPLGRNELMPNMVDAHA
jgi:hypothetical protein